MAEPWYIRSQREAAERVEALLSKPSPADDEDLGDEFFDPWEILPCLYGTYSSDFDRCAIEVLTEIAAGPRAKDREDLGAEMFREMLCRADLCEYGTSPRVCFATRQFEAVLPRLIEKWKAYSLAHWGSDVCAE